MARDAYYEESASPSNPGKERKIYTVFQILSYIFLAAAILLLFIFINYIPGIWKAGRWIAIIEWILFVGAFFCFFVGFFMIKKRYNVSYDYIFVQDELRISKVLNGKKRKFVKKFEAEFIMSVGWVKNNSFDRLSASYSKKEIIVLTPNKESAKDKEFFYIVYETRQEKCMYIIEARNELLEYLIPAVGMNKLERQ